MKPRITRYFSVLWARRWEWRCVGAGKAGFGETPKHAYWDWQYRMKFVKPKKEGV